MNRSVSILKRFSTRFDSAPVLRLSASRTMSAQPTAVAETEAEKSLKENPAYARYAHKIEQMKKNAPEKFEKSLKYMQEQQLQERENVMKDAEDEKKRLIEKAKHHREQGLDAIMMVDKLKSLTPDEITALWAEHHKNKDVIFAVIDADEWKGIQDKSVDFKMFVYPMPRDDGYEFFVQQFQGNEIHFTPLVQYQLHKENAPACLIMKHYTDVQKDKGIVLMVGEPDTKVLSVYEAQLLALQVKMYYGHQSALKFNFVRLMNNNPANFNYMDLIKQFENYKKDYRIATENRV